MTSRCPKCGLPVTQGQTNCTCGQFIPPGMGTSSGPTMEMPPEFYQRLESQQEKIGKDNFRRGLLLGIGFLALFLVLETAMDMIFIARQFMWGAVILAAVGIVGYYLFTLVRLLFRAAQK